MNENSNDVYSRMLILASLFDLIVVRSRASYYEAGIYGTH